MSSLLGQLVRAKRAEKSIRQLDLAEACDVCVATISLVENGQRVPSFDTLVKMADCLCIPIEDAVLYWAHDMTASEKHQLSFRKAIATLQVAHTLSWVLRPRG